MPIQYIYDTPHLLGLSWIMLLLAIWNSYLMIMSDIRNLEKIKELSYKADIFLTGLILSPKVSTIKFTKLAISLHTYRPYHDLQNLTLYGFIEKMTFLQIPLGGMV